MKRNLILLTIGIIFLGAGIALGTDSAIKGMTAATFWSVVTAIAGGIMVVNELSKKA